jgi:hypothetical protein
MRLINLLATMLSVSTLTVLPMFQRSIALPGKSPWQGATPVLSATRTEIEVTHGIASLPLKAVYPTSSQPPTDFSVAAAPNAAPTDCQQIEGKINSLKSQVSHLQALLKKASTGEKADLAGQIKDLNAQIAAKKKELEKCLCPGPDDSYYKLPFDNDPAWQLCKGNWDDPVNGHNKGDANGEQAYAFDFSYTTNHNCSVSTVGHKIRAMRAGVVIALAGDRSCNVWGLKKGAPCYGAPGEGNYVMIRHSDNTAAAYAHLLKGSLLVANGQHVARGQVIALSGNTGNSSAPHVHVDVRKYWNSSTDKGPTLPIKFQDKYHRCWRPRVGDTLTSNNN